jgi:hypothetical protein
MASAGWVPFARWAVTYLGAPIAAKLLSSNFDGHDTLANAAAVEGRRAELVFDRTSPGAEDVATCSFSLLNYTSGAVDTTWTTGDYDDCSAAIVAMWNAIKSKHYGCSLREIRYYREGPGIAAGAAGPAEHVHAVGVAATGVGMLPPQVACSITLRTALRPHWGRFYLPNIGTNQVSPTGGRSTLGLITEWANAVRAMDATLRSHDFRLVVFSRAGGGFLGVSAIEVDDVLDVIRRRRYQHAAAKVILNAPA